MNDNLEFSNLLRSKSLKATAYRLDLLKYIADYKSAIPYSKIRKKMIAIDRVTLYRTIDSFINKGIMHIAYNEENETYFALCKEECNSQEHTHKHIHFKCTVCNTVTCQSTNESIRINIPQFTIDEKSIQVTGRCNNCNKTSF